MNIKEIELQSTIFTARRVPQMQNIKLIFYFSNIFILLKTILYHDSPDLVYNAKNRIARNLATHCTLIDKKNAIEIVLCMSFVPFLDCADH